MNYKQTLEFLYKQLPCYQRIGAAAYKENLDNTIALLSAIGNPHLQIQTIHIAGTNGKGSISHMCASILQEAGYKTGLYTSPHLLDFRERIKINGNCVSKRYITDFVKKYAKIITDIQPSFFEITVAMSFDYFAKQNIDIAVIETGLGGRLDSTNVIIPKVSIISNIGLDHTHLLGNTIDKIAIEKAGIIKPNTPVIIGETQKEIKDIFITIAEKNKAPITFADAKTSLQLTNKQYWHKGFSIINSNSTIKNITSNLQGIYQQKNIITVAATISELQNQGLHITQSQFKKGIEKTIINTGLLGRWQIINKKPLIICDTAHNAEGIKETMKQLQDINKPDIHILWGMVDDKDVSKIIPLLPQKATYYVTKPNIERGMKIKKLASNFEGMKFKTFPTIANAYKTAIKNLHATSVLYIGGSTFVVAEFLSKKNLK